MSVWMLTLMSAPFVVALTAGLLMPLLLVGCARRPVWGMALVASVFVLDTWLQGSFQLRLGLTWYLPDLSVSLLAVVALWRWAVYPDSRPRSTWLRLFALAFFINLAQGLVQYKSGAGVMARPTFYALTCCAYGASFAPTTTLVRSWWRVLAWTALALCAITAWRLAITALDVRELLPPGGSFQPPGHSPWRVIVSNETLLVAEVGLSFAACSAVAAGWAGSRWLLASLMLLAVLVLQHRSVWLVMLTGLGAMLWLRPRRNGAAPRWLPIAALLLCAGLALGLSGRLGSVGGGVGADVAKSAADAAQLKGTAGERLESWGLLVQQWRSDGPRTWLLGSPFGASNLRTLIDEQGRTRSISYQPHNYYVELLTGQGAIGLLAYAMVWLSTLRGLWRQRQDPTLGASTRWLFMLVVCQMTYYLTYGVDYLQGLTLGIALALAGHGARNIPASRSTAANHQGNRRGRAGWRHPATLPRA